MDNPELATGQDLADEGSSVEMMIRLYLDAPSWALEYSSW
jgi:hypothetical protein